MKNFKVNGAAREGGLGQQTKKYLKWGVIVVAVVLIFGYMQLGWFNTPEYLLSVTAQDGAIVSAQDENGCFELTLKGVDRVTWFSDRPVRDAFSTEIPPLLEIWRDEFGSNPPNADLQLFDDDLDAVVILTLESTPVWGKDTETLIFGKACPIALIDENQASEVDLAHIVGKTFGNAVLFIDGTTAVKNPRLATESGPDPSAWNACYSSRPTGKDLCLQKLGSYDDRCGAVANVQYFPDKTCRAVCDKEIFFEFRDGNNENPIYLCTDFLGYQI